MLLGSKSPGRDGRPKRRPAKAHTPVVQAQKPALPPCLEELRRARVLAQFSQPTSPAPKALQASPCSSDNEGEKNPNAAKAASRIATVGPSCSPDLEPHRPLVGPLLPLKEKAPKEFESLADIVVALVTASIDRGDTRVSAKREATDLQADLGSTCGSSFGGMTAGRSADISRDQSPPKHPSVAVVVDCLEAVLMKGIEPIARVTNEKLAFVDRTLSSVVDAASWQLQATNARSRELLAEAEEVRVALQRKEHEFEEAEARVAKVFYRPKRQAMNAVAALEAVAEEVETLEARLQSDGSTCEELRQRVSDMLRVEREEWQKERDQLVAERDARLLVLAGLDERLPKAELDLVHLENEVNEQVAKADRTETEATDALPLAKDRFEELSKEHKRLEAQVREARAKLESKKPKKGKRK